MDAQQLVQGTFERLDQELELGLDGLTPEELAWRPDKEANAIGFLLWHMTRAEDIWVSGFALQRPHVFERDGWAQRWGIPAADTGFGYTGEQLARFPTPPIGELRQYKRGVRQQTLDYLQGLSPPRFRCHAGDR